MHSKLEPSRGHVLLCDSACDVIAEALTVVVICRLSVASSVVVVVVIIIACMEGWSLRHTSMLNSAGASPVLQLSMPSADSDSVQQDTLHQMSSMVQGNTSCSKADSHPAKCWSQVYNPLVLTH